MIAFYFIPTCSACHFLRFWRKSCPQIYILFFFFFFFLVNPQIYVLSSSFHCMDISVTLSWWIKKTISFHLIPIINISINILGFLHKNLDYVANILSSHLVCYAQLHFFCGSTIFWIRLIYLLYLVVKTVSWFRSFEYSQI